MAVIENFSIFYVGYIYCFSIFSIFHKLIVFRENSLHSTNLRTKDQISASGEGLVLYGSHLA